MIWQANLIETPPGYGLRLTVTLHQRPATFRELVTAWQSDASLREIWSEALAGVAFPGFRWECPPITAASVDRNFECVLLRSDTLSRQPESGPFAEFFTTARGASVVGFPSLGGDAFLIAPCPLAEASVYPHLASFLRGAPPEQIHALWERVAQEVLARLSERPLWLSTAGHGVAWLHVRLDSRPMPR